MLQDCWGQAPALEAALLRPSGVRRSTGGLDVLLLLPAALSLASADLRYWQKWSCVQLFQLLAIKLGSRIFNFFISFIIDSLV